MSAMQQVDFDIARARSETPGCRHVVHFNNAGAALMPQPVINAVGDYLRLEASIGGYEAAEQAHDKIDQVYDLAAQLVGCARNEIAIVENATRAWDMAFYSIPFKAGDRIFTSMAEYASNYIPFLQVQKRIGVTIEIVPNDEHGQLSLDALKEMADDDVRLIAITHVPTNCGLVNPADEIGKVARRVNALYLLDACQSVGQMPIDVERIGCDMLSATSRKFLRGPRGVGFLYVRSSLIGELEPPFLDLHAARWVNRKQYEIRSDARRFENWEANYAANVGLGAAISYSLEWGLDDIWRRVRFLGDTLREKLGEIPGITVHDLGAVKCGIVAFSLAGWDAEAVRRALRRGNINVSVARKEHTLLDMASRGLDTFVRASIHYYNSEDEIDRFYKTLKSIGGSPNTAGRY
ncbi:MAG: aminotransferase class V-fold PLP-dependent enzyme [Phycisphaerales bacterium]|nr:MAG: aminotransferase class V-fold PLP-dependent enzyme [Phycisphaerales bacterium]